MTCARRLLRCSRDVVIRRARIEDADPFVAVLERVANERRWIATEPGFDVDARRQAVRESIVGDRDALWVLEQDGDVVGTLGLQASRVPGVFTLGMAVVAKRAARAPDGCS